MAGSVKSPCSPTPKAKVWPSRSSLGTAKLVNTHDFEGARRIISTVSRQLFTQDGTVELMACHLNEKGMRIGTAAVYLNIKFYRNSALILWDSQREISSDRTYVIWWNWYISVSAAFVGPIGSVELNGAIKGEQFSKGPTNDKSVNVSFVSKSIPQQHRSV